MIKKLLIGASALALTTGVANAQIGVPPGGDTDSLVPALGTANTSNIDQRRNNNIADVNQTNAENSSAEIVQGRLGAGYEDSGNNTAEVTQRGAGKNAAYIDQVGTGRTNLNYTPAGSYNGPTGVPTATGQEQFAKITQTNNNSGANANQAAIQQGDEGVGGLNNRAEINQRGSGNEALIKQGGLGAGYTYANEEDGRMDGLIQQTGRNNTAETVQGEIDKSITIQNGNGNQAYVNQTPTTNPGGDDRLGRQSFVKQDGASNFAKVYQEGNYGDSSVDQSGNFNDADVAQYGVSDVSNVRQDGNSNEATVTQRGARAVSDVDQDGNRNTASITQRGDDVLSLVDQNGNNNEATVRQRNGSDGSTSDVDQDGNRNYASVEQSAKNADSFIVTSGNNNDVTVSQDGRRAVSIVGQGDVPFIAPNGTATNNSVEVTQEGKNVVSLVGQDGSNNKATVTQTGDRSTALYRPEPATLGNYAISQIGFAFSAPNSSAFLPNGGFSLVGQAGSDNKVAVEQAGVDNRSVVVQGVNFSPLSQTAALGNTAKVSQEVGSNNAFSAVVQGGTDNKARVIQSGQSAESLLLQQGNGNFAHVNQSGDGAKSLVTQYGISNDARVRQSLNDVISTVDQNGNDNLATVLQTQSVDQSVSFVSQNGNNNVATVRQ